MITRALREVFRNRDTCFLSGAVSLVAFSLAVWLPNARLLFAVATSEDASFVQAIVFAFRLFASITTNFTALSASYTIAIALLIGMNTTLIVYLIKRQGTLLPKTGTATGILGFASGILGIGCTVCGSVILTSVLAIFGAAGALAFLPLRGGEFGILGTLLLLVSFFLLAKQIASSQICYPK